MEYILVHNGTFDNELYQVENTEYFKGNVELIMYYDDCFSANECSINELMADEPWTKRPQVQQPPEASINVALLEQF